MLLPLVTVFTTPARYGLWRDLSCACAGAHRGKINVAEDREPEGDTAIYHFHAQKDRAHAPGVGKKEKTGAEIKGVHAKNPATGEHIPTRIADYVLAGYGTGAIRRCRRTMSATLSSRKNLTCRCAWWLQKRRPHRPGRSRRRSRKRLHGPFRKIYRHGFRDREMGDREFSRRPGREHYKLRDWSVSRQRYWGMPVPMVHCAKCGIVPVPEKDLPVMLPDLENYRPQGVPPLAELGRVHRRKCPQCGGEATRDPETLDTFVDSSWYFLRYADPHNARGDPFEERKSEHWMPVDLLL